MALQGNFKTQIADLVTSLTAAEIANIDQAIWEEVFELSNFANAHTVVTGRRHGNLQPIINGDDPYGYMPVADNTSCDLNECDITPVYSSKEWCMAEYNCRLAVCMRTFDEDFLVFWNMYRQQLEDPLAEPDAQAFLDYLVNLVTRRISGTQWRAGYWGDSEAVDNSLIDGCDGFFIQAEAGGGEKVSITGSGDNGAVVATDIYAALQSAYEYAVEQPWGGADNLVWKMTQTMAARLVAWLNTSADLSQYNCECINPVSVTNPRGFTTDNLKIFGIPVEAHREIDASMTAAGATGAFRAILTRKTNLLVGVNKEEKLEGFDIFFDRVSRKIYLDAMTYFGVMIPTDEYVYISEVTSS